MRFLALFVLFCLPACSSTWHYAECEQINDYSRAGHNILSTADRYFMNRSPTDPRGWWDRSWYSVSMTGSVFNPMR